MPINILVADDSTPDRLLIKDILSDYIVWTASDGSEAIRILESHSGISLLILDLHMPKMDGFGVLEYLKNSSRFERLRTIILTVADETDREIRGLRLGAVDFIRKPIHVDTLKARIEVHIALILAEQELEENRHSLKQKLDEQILTFEMVFEQAPIGISISHNCLPKNEAEPRSTRINPMYEQITGRSKEELIKLGWAKITHPDDIEEELYYFNRLETGKITRYSMEKRFIRPDGSIVWVYLTVSALLPVGENKFNYICLIQDITDIKQIEYERKYITEHDKWTGLYNREYLVSLLEKHARIKSDNKKALIGINLSMVQLITANYGYQYSQNLIKKAAEELSRYCNDNCILIYLSENRFVFYVYDYKIRCDLARFCSRIAETLESLFVTDRIGGGIGIVEIECGQSEIDVDLLLRKLLIASERSVGMLGKNFQVIFYNYGLEALINRERDIVEALNNIASGAKTGNALYLMYQPIIDLKTGEVCAFEALARLSTQKLGMVSPLEFIPVAEKTKLIIPIGEKVFYDAFCFLDKLRDFGYANIGVSVNVSVIQLLSPEFAGRLFDLIAAMDVDTRNVCIEITESVFASDYETLNRIFEKLRSVGLHIAIDDFGTGYSSFAREKELKVDFMKIDKYFIDGLCHADPSKAITGDIISIAHRLGQYTIAEGVEYESQLRYLAEHSCDRIQGYFISKPLDADAAIEFLRSYNSKFNCIAI